MAIDPCEMSSERDINIIELLLIFSRLVTAKNFRQ